MLAHLPPGLAGMRDRALLLLGYTGGLRRSELAALTSMTLPGFPKGSPHPAALEDRPGRAGKKGRPTQGSSCRHLSGHRARPVAGGDRDCRGNALPRSRRVGKAGIHRDSVGSILKRAVTRAGFDPVEFAGHSLRADFATQAARNGARAFDIMRQTRHCSITTVSRYVRDAQILEMPRPVSLGSRKLSLLHIGRIGPKSRTLLENLTDHLCSYHVISP